MRLRKQAYDLLLSILKTKHHKFIQVTDNPDIEHALRLLFVKRLRNSYY